ncbi:MAG TPA: DotU family type VI secretion system protein [Nevskiaceae bacterium]|nr:DotU family type VI secretion system protein [Nevskiaceae bacterium]
MATDPDDPFAPRPDDRTVMVPKPRKAGAQTGGPTTSMPTPTTAVPTPTAPSRPAPQVATPRGAPSLDNLPDTVGANPLVAAATPILALIPQLRVASQADPVAVKNNLVNGIRSFEQSARRAQIPTEQVVAARYVLCTFVDETAANTPWGGSGQWAAQSLLVTFHNEAWGGEKTFQLLAKLAEDPAKNRDLLTLLEVCLAMGFQGRYRVLDNGQAQLTAVRERLFEILRPHRGEPEKELSPRWKGATLPKSTLLAALPLWVVAAATALVLTITFLVLVSVLNRKSDPVFASIRGIVPPAAEQRAAPPTSTPAPPRLRTLLASDIAASYVDVGDYADRSVVTIRSDGFFAPGSNTIPDKMLPLLDRIGAALNQVPGKVLIIGHSDNVPIRSMRFPSNWHLSMERAKTVAEHLGDKVEASRIRSEGRADAEPLAPNDTPANRAKNRRVDIWLLVS